MHRLPVLRSGVPVLGAAIQLLRAEDSARRAEPRHQLPVEPAAVQGRRGEVHVLSAPHARRPPARLPGGVPTGARKFGNVLDPDSEISQILQTKRVFVLKEEIGTLPRFFYYFDERYPRTGATDDDLAEASG